MARIRTGDIRVTGLRELQAALKTVSHEANRELRDAGKKAAETVVSDAQSLANAQGSTAAKVAPSIRASGGVRSAGVTFGGAAYPFAAGAEFGAYRYKQFRPWRGNGSGAGYFIYPAIRSNVDNIINDYQDAIVTLMRRHDLR